MVICKFFLEGRCRFGAHCKNEHTQDRPVSYQQPAFNQPVRQQYFPQQQQLQQTGENIKLENLLYVVKDDANNSLQGGQWLFSCYAPLLRRFTKVPSNNNEENLPNLMDYSPEEFRWEAISSNFKGEFHDYTIKLQQLSQYYYKTQTALQNLDQTTSNFIVRYEQGENISPAGTALANCASSFSPNIATGSTSSSQFSFTLPSTQPSQNVVAPFKFQLPSQQSQQPAVTPFSFKLNSQLPAATVTTPAPFTFQRPQQAAQLVPVPASSFSFKLPSQQPNLTVNLSVPTQTVSHNAENPSYAHQLSQNDIQQFEAEKFSFGKIPRVPPPKMFR